MAKLAKVFKAIARFLNRAVMDMADDRPGGGMAARQEREEDIPPDWLLSPSRPTVAAHRRAQPR